MASASGVGAGQAPTPLVRLDLPEIGVGRQYASGLDWVFVPGAGVVEWVHILNFVKAVGFRGCFIESRADGPATVVVATSASSGDHIVAPNC